MSRVALSHAVCVLSLAAVAWPAQAEPPARPSAALLPPALKKLPPEREAGLGAIVQAELEGLGLFQLQPRERVEPAIARLVEQKIYTDSCLEQVACTRRVGTALRAVWLFHLSAAQSLGGVTLSVRAFDARTGELLRNAGRFAGEGPGELERAVAQAVRLAAGPVLAATRPGRGHLALQVEPADVEILVDGAPCLTCDGPAGAELSSGAYELVVRRADYLPFAEVVVIRAGQESRLTTSLQLTPEAEQARAEAEARRLALAEEAARRAAEQPEPPPPEPPEESSAFYQTWWFWTVVGVAVGGGLGVGLYFGLRDEGPQGRGDIQVGWE